MGGRCWTMDIGQQVSSTFHRSQLSLEVIWQSSILAVSADVVEYKLSPCTSFAIRWPLPEGDLLLQTISSALQWNSCVSGRLYLLLSFIPTTCNFFLDFLRISSGRSMGELLLQTIAVEQLCRPMPILTSILNIDSAADNLQLAHCAIVIQGGPMWKETFEQSSWYLYLLSVPSILLSTTYS